MRYVISKDTKEMGNAASSHLARIVAILLLSACIGATERGSLTGGSSSSSNGNTTSGTGDIDSTDDLIEGSANLYFTDARVSANSDVSANSASRHDALTLGTANGLSLSGQQLSLQTASGSQAGALSASDYNTFNAKESSLSNPTGSSNSKVLTSTTGGSRSWGYQSEVFNAGRELRMNDEWINNGTAGQLAWTATVSGTGAAAAINTSAVTASHPGVVQLSTGTTATGRTALHLGTNGVTAGGAKIIFETVIQLSAVANGTESYTTRIGLGDATGAGDNVDGIYFEYSQAAANWQIKTSNNSARTTLDSGVAATVNWVKLRFEVNDDGTSANFYIDGISVGTITTNIPTSAARLSSPLYKIEKTLGITARLLHVDYFNFAMIFNNASR